MNPRAGFTVDRATLKVYTARGVQHHRGYVAYIRTPEDPHKPVKCCQFHQKASGARRHGQEIVNRLNKEAGR